MEKRRSKEAAFEVQQTLKSSKRKHISKSNVMDIIKSQEIRSETELLVLANERADDSLDDLNFYCRNTRACLLRANLQEMEISRGTTPPSPSMAETDGKTIFIQPDELC